MPSCNALALTCRACAGLNRETGVFDPAFREQFEISRPSQAYQALLAAVPVAFVGSEERLTATVRLLCKELQTEFAEKGVTLPPWRDVQAMLTKWRPSAGPSARASMGSAPVPRPAVHQAAAAQLLQPPAAVKHDFFLGVPSLGDSTRPRCPVYMRRLLLCLWVMHAADLPTNLCSARAHADKHRPPSSTVAPGGSWL